MNSLAAADSFGARTRVAYDLLPKGARFTFRRTFSDGDITMFVGATADYNVWHTDLPFLEGSPFHSRLVPGLLTASLATHIGSWLGWLATRLDVEFLKPVYTGDTVSCMCVVVEKYDERRRVRCELEFNNQHTELVAAGIMEGFPTRVPPAAEPYRSL